jgi:acetyl esterase/lipase
VERDVARRIAAIGGDVSPETLDASRAVYADAHERPPYDGVVLARDVAYGPHERHRLDLFAAPGARDLPVILFVHGGGFVRGDKSTPGTPHNENVGLWAARSGMVGVTMNYRLAPEHRWPVGAQDVGAAVAWLRANVAEHGGDPERIVLVGSSAGATHIASYAALPELHPDGEAGVRGLVLLSGAYDLASFDDEAVLGPYFGARSQWDAASPLAGLVASQLPVMVAVAEHDPRPPTGRRPRPSRRSTSAVAACPTSCTSRATTTSPRSFTSTRTTGCSASRSPPSCRPMRRRASAPSASRASSARQSSRWCPSRSRIASATSSSPLSRVWSSPSVEWSSPR